jgi:hypothetical protein
MRKTTLISLNIFFFTIYTNSNTRTDAGGLMIIGQPGRENCTLQR